MEDVNNSGRIAAVSDPEDSTTLPVPPDGDNQATEGASADTAAADGEIMPKKRTRFVFRTFDPPPPPKQVEIGRRAQVRHLELSRHPPLI